MHNIAHSGIMEDMNESARLNISLPNQMLTGITDLVHEGEFSTPSEFVRDAVRREMDRRKDKVMRGEALAQLKSLAEEAVASGDAVEIKDVRTWKDTQLEQLEKRAGSNRKTV